MADRSKPRIIVAGVTVLVALAAGSLPAAAHDRD